MIRTLGISAPGAGLHVPRRASPRTHVPAGAVGLAGEFSGIYPKVSPGGWQLIGTTPLTMFDLDRKPAALLQPGQHVRFRDMAGATVHPVAKISAEDVTAAAAAPECGIEGLHLDVLSAALPALFQDYGRPGLAVPGWPGRASAARARRTGRACRWPTALRAIPQTRPLSKSRQPSSPSAPAAAPSSR